MPHNKSAPASMPAQHAESRLPALDFDLSPMSALLVDAGSLRILAANCAAESLYGYAQDEFLNLRLDDLVIAGDGRQSVAARTLADGSVVECEVQRHRRRDGAAFPALCASRTAVANGKEVVVINTFDAGDLRLGPAIQVQMAQRDEAPSVRETILVVDDDATVRAPMCRALRRSGHTVLEAGDGEEALRVLQEHHEPIPLVISDVMMPELGGAELIEMLHGWYPSMRVLFISGFGAGLIDEREELAQCGFLAKPFTMGELTARVAELLEVR